MQHTQLASGTWQKLTTIEQMANIGSEVIRASRWKEKANEKYMELAFERALELILLSIQDPQNRNCLAEFTRMQEVVVDYFFGENVYKSSAENFTRYFMIFNKAARVLT